MHVTTNDAINAFSLLRDHVSENGFLHECYNLGISALKTIQDGNYQLQTTNVSRETLEVMANFSCSTLKCEECIYYNQTEGGKHICMSLLARGILCHERNVKEIEAWINKNSKN